MFIFATAIAWGMAFLTAVGVVFYLLAFFGAWSFQRTRWKKLPDYYPAVSILKPMKGIDPDMYESLASHCRQEYAGEYELIFGVSSLEDSAVPAVERLQKEFPEKSIRLVLCPQSLGPNGKVSNLVQMLPHAKYGHILINDSDIRVSRQYLRRIMTRFQSPNKTGRSVGMVTALYRGKAHDSIGSKMESLGISTDFMSGVLTARALEGGIHFGLGSTLAVSPEALASIGGLTPLVEYLADDYELGARVAKAGFDVVLSSDIVETTVPPYKFSAFLQHQLRWNRSIRDSRKLGYVGLAFTFGLPWAFLNLIVSGLSPLSLWLFSLALLARTSLALMTGVIVLRDYQVLRDLWLLLPRDLVAMGLWIWSFAGNTIAWRGETFFLKDGKLVKSS
jgi:ceramide glucosyltransferase